MGGRDKTVQNLECQNLLDDNADGPFDNKTRSMQEMEIIMIIMGQDKV